MGGVYANKKGGLEVSKEGGQRERAGDGRMGRMRNLVPSRVDL